MQIKNGSALGAAPINCTGGNCTQATGTLSIGNTALGANGSITPGLAPTAVAYVETWGSDSTGHMGSPNNPYLTINAALTALPSTGGTVMLGIGAFTAVTDDSGGSSKLKSNVTFVGAQQPVVNGANTALAGGSTIQGPLRIDTNVHSGIKFYNLGIDVGSAIVTANYSGVAQEGLEFYNKGQVTPGVPSTGNLIHNVTVLSASASASVHAILIENVDGFEGMNLTSVFGQHGVVLKATHSTVRSIRAYGHAGECLDIAQGTYAASSNLVVSDVYCATVAPGDTGAAVQLINSGSGAAMTGVVVSGVVSVGATTGVAFVGDGTFNIANSAVIGYVASGYSTYVSATNISPTTVTVNGLLYDNSAWNTGGYATTGSGALYGQTAATAVFDRSASSNTARILAFGVDASTTAGGFGLRFSKANSVTPFFPVYVDGGGSMRISGTNTADTGGNLEQLTVDGALTVNGGNRSYASESSRGVLAFSGGATYISSFGASSGTLGNIFLYQAGSNNNNGVIAAELNAGNFGIGTSADALGSRLTVKGGDVNVTDAASGLILKDTVSGTCYRVQITSGVLVPTSLTCPAN